MYYVYYKLFYKINQLKTLCFAFKVALFSYTHTFNFICGWLWRLGRFGHSFPAIQGPTDDALPHTELQMRKKSILRARSPHATTNISSRSNGLFRGTVMQTLHYGWKTCVHFRASQGMINIIKSKNFLLFCERIKKKK